MDKAAKDSVASSQVPVIVGDTTCKIDDNTSYNYWGRLFQMWNNEDFTKLISPEDDAKACETIYKNIARSGLHKAAARPAVFPC